MRSLRVRLLAIVAFVSMVAVVTVVLVSREGVRSEFMRFETRTGAMALEDAAEAVRSWVDAGGDPVRSEEILKRFDRPGHRSLVLVDSTGNVLSVSSPRLHRVRVDLSELHDRIEVLRDKVEGNRRTVERTIVRGAPHQVIAGSQGSPPVFLYAVPLSGLPGGPAAPYVRSVNRWMIGAIAAAAALAMIVTWLLSRRIVGPVEALTSAARRMERGDWSARVAVRSKDEIGDLSHAFNAMAEALARNETVRRQLVTDVAHELRTPLTNLRAQLEAIEDGLVPADASSLRSLHEETLLLSRLVEDLQDLSLAEAGRLRLDRAPVAPGEVLDAAAAAFRARCEERGIALGVAPESAGAPRVSADAGRLAQILRNLLANAMTHTPKGGSLTLAASPEGAFVRFEVRDTGDGIAPEHLPHVFDRFYRADASRSRVTGGAGLGLPIVKQLVEAHGGSVAIDSGPDRGTAISFTIPLA
ncbi:MAG TPA: ATP-binding protein [Acidobacteriota bacterium]|nr:ATP-binding protein [Acidobacteriota bacterium]